MSEYLKNRDKWWNAGFQAGLRAGRQQMMDMTSLVLRDPEYVKKDIFGGGRLSVVWQGVKAYIEKYQKAWEKHPETDHVQKQLDENLAEAYGEKLRDSFHERYPDAPRFDYKKGKWK